MDPGNDNALNTQSNTIAKSVGINTLFTFSIEETHLYIEIKSKIFKDKTKIESHRLINSIIKEEYNKGLHSLEIKIIYN